MLVSPFLVPLASALSIGGYLDWARPQAIASVAGGAGGAAGGQGGVSPDVSSGVSGGVSEDVSQGVSPAPRVSPFDSCPVDTPLTCTNNTPIENSCCFESPGGIFLQTQFWDYYPPVGDNDSFTLHGLWPDNCDGTYEQFCDSKLNIQRGDVEQIVVEQFGNQALYQKIQRYWKNFNGDDESLWVHEFNKHATCIKTIRPACYGDSFKKNENVYDFLDIAVDMYEKYPTFQFLKDAGIEPSLTKTYTFDEIANALNSRFGDNRVFFKCNRYQALQEVWYFHHLQGPLKGGNLVPMPAMAPSSCPKTGIKFLPKEGFRPPTPPKNPSGKRGQLKPSGHSGCLISNGQWYGKGTCATFSVTDSSLGGKNLRSSKGVCGVDENGVLNCNRQNDAARFQFQLDKSSNALTYGGNSQWCFDEAGKHGSGSFVQIPVKLSNGNCDSFEIKLV